MVAVKIREDVEGSIHRQVLLYTRWWEEERESIGATTTSRQQK